MDSKIFASLHTLLITSLVVTPAFWATGATATSFSPATPTRSESSPSLIAQGCRQYLGEAVTGVGVVLDTCSITFVSAQAVNFVYYLGKEKINAQANCRANTWTTFPERAVHRPRSGATQSMLDIVCN